MTEIKEIIKNILTSQSISNQVNTLDEFKSNSICSACIIPPDRDSLSGGMASKKENFKLDIFIFHSKQGGKVDDYDKKIEDLLEVFKADTSLKSKVIKINFRQKHDFGDESYWITNINIEGEKR